MALRKLITSASALKSTAWAAVSGIAKEHAPRANQAPAEPARGALDSLSVGLDGYAKSINARREIEKVVCWIKQWSGLRQFKLRGTEKVGAVFSLHAIAFNLIRLGNLLKGKPSPTEWPLMAGAWP